MNVTGGRWRVGRALLRRQRPPTASQTAVGRALLRRRSGTTCVRGSAAEAECEGEVRRSSVIPWPTLTRTWYA